MSRAECPLPARAHSEDLETSELWVSFLGKASLLNIGHVLSDKGAHFYRCSPLILNLSRPQALGGWLDGAAGSLQTLEMETAEEGVVH